MGLRRFRRALAPCACAVLTGLAPPPAARAELPALSREFRTERYVIEPGELAAVRAQRRVVFALAAGPFLGGDRAGSANPFGGWQRIAGGTVEAGLQVGRYALGANAVADTWRAVDPGEFAQRLSATAYVPEARISLVGSVGFGEGEYAGADLTAEVLALRWRALRSGADLTPRVWLWTRVRRRATDDRTVLTPAAALFVQHFVVVGSQLDLGLSAQSELADGLAPVSRAMFQAGFGSVPRPLWSRGEPDAPGAEESSVRWNWFVTLAHAVPLDDRGRAGLALQGGARFARPLGR
jgi:hypothetical protein